MTVEMPYQPIGDRARLARRTLVAAVVVYVLAVGAGLFERSVLAGLAAGEEVSAGEASFSDTCQLVVDALLALALAVNAVTFIRWLSLAYRNLPALGVRHLRHQTWWAIGGWFIPVFWLFRPKEIVNDVWRGSDPVASPSSEWFRRPVPRLFVAWWAMWWVTNVLSYVALRMLLGAGDRAAELLGATTLYLISDALSVVAGVLAIQVVGRVTARQEERARLLATSRATVSGGPGEPPARDL